LNYEWVIIPHHLMLYTKGVAEVVPDLLIWLRPRNVFFLRIRNMFGEVELFILPWCGCSVPRRKRKTKYCLPIIR
jgi:hypothetical protein